MTVTYLRTISRELKENHRRCGPRLAAFGAHDDSQAVSCLWWILGAW